MSRLEWILTGLLAILVVVVMVLLLLFWSGQRQTENFNRQIGTQGAPAEQERGTAQRAYEVAAPAARGWAADAVLIQARGSWPKGTFFRPESAGWSFLFYSPGQRQVALVVADRNGARIMSSNETEQTFDTASLDSWQIDSPAVVDTLMASGGQSFVEQHGESNLKVSLNTTEGLIWEATLIANSATETFRLQIDPITGQIIE